MPRNGINVKFSLKANCYIIGVCAGIQECPRLLKNSRLSGNGCASEGYSPRSEPEATSSLRRSPEERWVKPYLSKDRCLTSLSFVLCVLTWQQSCRTGSPCHSRDLRAPRQWGGRRRSERSSQRAGGSRLRIKVSNTMVRVVKAE